MSVFDPRECVHQYCWHFAVPGSELCATHSPRERFKRMHEHTNERQTWDQTWLSCAHTMAKRSRCSRAQVGAVVVAEDQTVVSMSYNGPPKDFPTTDGDCSNWCPRAMGSSDPSPTYDDCPAVHAEANAIARADFSKMKDATIYVSTSCCKGCAKLLANAGIKRVVFQNEAGREYRHPQETIDFLLECGIEVSIV